jgi:hypothetical protein
MASIKLHVPWRRQLRGEFLDEQPLEPGQVAHQSIEHLDHHFADQVEWTWKLSGRLIGSALVTMRWDHDHRADRVEHGGMADRPEQQLGEAPTSP